MATYERNENMEFGEQVLRGGVALIMMATVLTTPALSPAIIAGLSLAAIYAAFTAVTGWDPLYALGQALQPAPAPVPAPVKIFPARLPGAGGRHKKAA